MFFISVGSSSQTFDHGPILPYCCRRCNQVTYWRMFQDSISTTIYFVPISPTDTYRLVCQCCGFAIMLNTDQVQRAIYMKQFTFALFNQQMSEEEYKQKLEEVKYLH